MVANRDNLVRIALKRGIGGHRWRLREKTLKRSFISSRWRYSLKLFKWECSFVSVKECWTYVMAAMSGRFVQRIVNKGVSSVSGTYMSPKDLAKLLVSLCSFFFVQGEQVLQDKYSTRLLVDPNENFIHTKRKRRLLSSTVPSLG